jgi:hypothetical protein
MAPPSKINISTAKIVMQTTIMYCTISFCSEYDIPDNIYLYIHRSSSLGFKHPCLLPAAIEMSQAAWMTDFIESGAREYANSKNVMLTIISGVDIATN